MPIKLKDLFQTPIVTTQAGAYMRPEWFNFTFEGRDMTQVLSIGRQRALYEDALKIVYHEQELIGMDLFTDGGLRYDYGDWSGHLLGRLGGIKWENQFPPLGGAYEGLPMSEFLREAQFNYARKAVVVEKLSRGNLQFADFYKFAKRLTDRPLRYSTPEACITQTRLSNKLGVYKDDTEMFFDLCKIINLELRDLVSAGCNIVQLDYPFAHEFYLGTRASPDKWKIRVDGFNAEVEGINAQIWIHVDWGRPQGQMLTGEVRSFEEMFRRIGDAKVDVVGMEAASTYGENLDKELPLWKEYCSDMDICIGVVNHRRLPVETPEQVAGIIKKALKYVPPEKLAVYNDCGLSYLPRNVAYGKLRAIVQGAKLARRELGIK